jgi:NDP-sugar pyrophosphorylase family protein
MKAMILAAGLGTRLHPITQEIPKALAKINHLTLLEILIKRLKQFNIDEIIINVHHFADQIISYVEEHQSFGIHIRFSDEREQLLDTGGGIKHAAWFFDDGHPFLVHNVDVISSVDLFDFAEYHKKMDCIATLAVRRRKSSRVFLFNDRMRLSGWKSYATKQKIITLQNATLHELAFSGMHMINPEIFDFIENTGKFSIVDAYLQLSKVHQICAYPHDRTYWLDLGNETKLKQAANILHHIL